MIVFEKANFKESECNVVSSYESCTESLHVPVFIRLYLGMSTCPTDGRVLAHDRVSLTDGG